MAVFEPLVAHQFNETRSFFAMVAACGSRTPRPCRRWVCYFILVAGIACTTLSSKFAYERMAVDKAWRCTGAAG